jgi:hypothetical protein
MSGQHKSVLKVNHVDFKYMKSSDFFDLRKRGCYSKLKTKSFFMKNNPLNTVGTAMKNFEVLSSESSRMIIGGKRIIIIITIDTK